MQTYLGGESYAGQFIPYFGELSCNVKPGLCNYTSTPADAILSSNLNIPLRGIAIGNGWMDARRQYPAYLDYAVKHGIIELGSDVRTSPFIFLLYHFDKASQEYEESKKNTDTCMDELSHITDHEPISIPQCENLVRSVLAGKDTAL